MNGLNSLSSVKIPIAADHAGFALKEKLKSLLPQIAWQDFGTYDTARVDYPDFADRVAKEVSSHGGFAVLICGSGQGMAIRANRYTGVRAAIVWDNDSAKLAREHNDANIICLGARFITASQAKAYLELFLKTSFAGGRHVARVQKLGRTI
jgi:ribose 5-phosphate isomerase B